MYTQFLGFDIDDFALAGITGSDDPWFIAALAALALIAIHATGLLLVLFARLRWHWFFRAMLNLAVPAMFMALSGPGRIPAHDLVLTVFAQTVVVLMPWLIWPRKASSFSETVPNRRRRGRFTLLDIVLLVAVVAIIFAVGVRIPADYWRKSPWFLGIGMVAGVSTLAAATVGLNIGRWWSRLMLLPLAVPSLGVLVWLWLSRIVLPEKPDRESPAEPPTWKTARHWAARGAACVSLLALTAFIYVPFAALFARLASPKPLGGVPATADDSLQELLKTAELIGTVPDLETPDGSRWATFAQVDEFVSDNHEGFRIVHQALVRPFAVFPDLTAGVDDVDLLMTLRHVGRALSVASLSAARMGEQEQAADFSLDCYRLGKKTGYGGLFVHFLVGQAVQGVALNSIEQYRDRLDADSAIKLSKRLLALEPPLEPVEAMLDREEAWSSYHGGWPTDLDNCIWRLLGEPREFLDTCEIAVNDLSALLRLLAIDLAIRAYFQHNNALPETLDQLVPSYLGDLPRDPWNDGEFHYRVKSVDDEPIWRRLSIMCELGIRRITPLASRHLPFRQLPPYQLYSVGRNRINDDGMPGSVGPYGPDGDINLSPPENWLYVATRPYWDLNGTAEFDWTMLPIWLTPLDEPELE